MNPMCIESNRASRTPGFIRKRDLIWQGAKKKIRLFKKTKEWTGNWKLETLRRHSHPAARQTEDRNPQWLLSDSWGPQEGWPADCWSPEGAQQWPKVLPEEEKEKGKIPLLLPSLYPPARSPARPFYWTSLNKIKMPKGYITQGSALWSTGQG